MPNDLKTGWRIDRLRFGAYHVLSSMLRNGKHDRRFPYQGDRENVERQKRQRLCGEPIAETRRESLYEEGSEVRVRFPYLVPHIL